MVEGLHVEVTLGERLKALVHEIGRRVAQVLIPDQVGPHWIACLTQSESDLAFADLAHELRQVDRVHYDVHCAQDEGEEAKVPVGPSVGEFV